MAPFPCYVYCWGFWRSRNWMADWEDRSHEIPEAFGGLFVLAFVCSVFPLLCLPLSSCCLSAVLAQHWLWSAADTVDLKVQMASQGSAHSQSVWPFHGLPACLYRAWGWERVNLVLLFYINMSFCKYVTVWNYFVPVYIVWGLWIFLYQCKYFLYISARIIWCFTL